ncbi:radical SAM protein [Brenneria tiliae]|uniref:radical SAM protein n=1 Tax=Brenneria tiliae TaxID=2914984 RepID=UPI0020148EDB|nr:radical SAM protein [Brenneria tiliae]MCL2897115.1 radical SAM protein [Brenneria tiliae]MCL2904768.1 radical SAM protein [Brenneria tiliae]
MLLGTSFESLAENTVDYWMKGRDENLTEELVYNKLMNLKWHDDSHLQIYIHVPFCTQKCTFCAFSGGNTADFKLVELYANNIIKQLSDILHATKTYNKKITSINIGGGSPDLLSSSIVEILDFLVSLPGYTKQTEISIEFSLYSINESFINGIEKFDITRASFGVQTLNPKIRKYLRMPAKLRHLDEICERLIRHIPIINVDLMTGFPDQTINDVLDDINFFVAHPYINSISSYIFSQGAAPVFIADVLSHKIPAPPSQEVHANLRLQTYATLLKYGWKRFGTCTYYDVNKIPKEQLSKLSGNEALGAHAYEDFVIGVGSSAISYFPGLRLENISDHHKWISAISNNNTPYDLEKSSIEDQYDMALWGFPLKYHGLSVEKFDKMSSKGIINQKQIQTFKQYIESGLIYLNNNNYYDLTITGEIFMGHLVRGLKNDEDQKVIDEYVDEGKKIGEMISLGKIRKEHNVNNRQLNLLRDQDK